MARSLKLYCPYLGTKFDRQTRWGYASHLATCYLSEQEPFSPSLSHQQRFCLTDNHPQCFRLVSQGSPSSPEESHDLIDELKGQRAPRQPRQAVPHSGPRRQFFRVPNLSLGALAASLPSLDLKKQALGLLGLIVLPLAMLISAAGRLNGVLALSRVWVAGLAAVLLLAFGVIFGRQLFGAAASGPGEPPRVVQVVVSPSSDGEVSSTSVVPDSPIASPTPVSPQAAPTAPTPQAKSSTPAPAAKSPSPTPTVGGVQAASVGNKGQVYNTGGEGLSLRASPSTASQRLAVMPEGATVQILETQQNAQGKWYRVSYNTLTGWASASYIR